MSTLAEAFAKAAAQHKDDQISRMIVSFAVEGMWPFRAGTVSLWLDYNVDYLNRTLWVEAEAVRSYPFSQKLDDRLLHQAYEPESYLIESVRRPIIEHFRYRPRVEPDDHIVLGED